MDEMAVFSASCSLNCKFYACCIIILFDFSFAKERIASCINPVPLWPPSPSTYMYSTCKITEQPCSPTVTRCIPQAFAGNVHMYGVHTLRTEGELYHTVSVHHTAVFFRVLLHPTPGNVSSLFGRSSDVSGEFTVYLCMEYGYRYLYFPTSHLQRSTPSRAVAGFMQSGTTELVR